MKLESGQSTQYQVSGRCEEIRKLRKVNPDNLEMKNVLIAAYYFPPYALVSNVQFDRPGHTTGLPELFREPLNSNK